MFAATFTLSLLFFAGSHGYPTYRGSVEYWSKIAEKELHDTINQKRILTRAKNMILFIGDGMSISTVTAARFWKAQKVNASDPGRSLLAFENTTNTALSKTYTDDFMVADSAATATAMLSGVKTNSLTVGVNSQVKFLDCLSYSPDKDLTNIFTYASQAGLSTGIVTTTEVTHATPASGYAHSAGRFWASDADMPDSIIKNKTLRERCPDIASQFPKGAVNFNVVLGGGWAKFKPQSVGGDRKDGKDIVEEWKQEQKDRKRKYEYVTTKISLDEAVTKGIDHVLGIFTKTHFPYSDERKGNPKYNNLPTLADMVAAAIKLLSRNEKGYLLLVEGGRIDHAHHDGRARRSLEEVLEFDKSYEAAESLSKPDETLMITTADHSHTFSIVGYPARGTNIFTFPDQNLEKKGPGIALDNQKYTILAYANGPGAPIGKKRGNPADSDTTSVLYKQQAIVPLSIETHGGDDVGIYAKGPMAHLVRGVKEQNFLAHIYMYAGCLGPYRTKGYCPTSGVSSVAVASIWIHLLCVYWIARSLF